MILRYPKDVRTPALNEALASITALHDRAMSAPKDSHLDKAVVKNLNEMKTLHGLVNAARQ